MDQDKPVKKRGDAKPKVDFVLGLPMDTPSAEVSAKATVAGLVISPDYVNTIRSSERKRAREAGDKPMPAKPKARKAAGKGARKKAKPPVPKVARSKSAFILDQPREMNAVEVVAKGKAAGLTFSANYVHKVRTEAKKGAKGKGTSPAKVKKPARPAAKKTAQAKKATPITSVTTKRAPAKKAAAKKRTVTVVATKPAPQSRVEAKPASSEVLFRRLLLELGLKRSRELMEEVQRKLAELSVGD